MYPEVQCGFRRARPTIDMLSSLRQLQEKCREQQVSLYIAFIDRTKAFDLVSRSGLFQLLEKIGCPPKLLSMITAFHSNMRSTVRYDGAVSNAFPINIGVNQGCVLVPTLFGIFFSLVLSHAFRTSEDGIYIHTRSDGKLFNLARKQRVRSAKSYFVNFSLPMMLRLRPTPQRAFRDCQTGLVMPVKNLA